MLRQLQKLWDTARACQAYADTIDLLQPQKWLETDPDKLQEIVYGIMDARCEQRRLLEEHGVVQLLHTLDNMQKVPPSADIPFTTPVVMGPWDKQLIVSMKRLCENLLPLGDNHIRAMEHSTASSEAEWLESFDIAEKYGTAAAFDAQKSALRKVFGLRRALALKVSEGTARAPSEVVLDEWNPWMTNADVDTLFAKAQRLYPALIQEIAQTVAHKPSYTNPFNDPAWTQKIENKFTRENQLAFFKKVQQTMLLSAGWSAEALQQAGVTLRDLDFLPNPFCWGTRKEAWVTVEDRNGDFMTGLKNTLHETGHLLYLLSLNTLHPQLRDTPLGQVNGYGVHEITSMYFEQTAGKEHFWRLMAPMVRDHFGVEGDVWSAENLRRVANDPSLDDMKWGTSELALMPNMYFRTMAERRIMDGHMAVEDLPAFYEETMTALTGIPHHAKDFMVDESHWFDRQTGYFPAYWIGALCGARLNEMVNQRQIAQVDNLVDYFGHYHEVVHAHIFKHASLDKPLDLIQHELGGRPEHFLATYLHTLADEYLDGHVPEAIVTLLQKAQLPIAVRDRKMAF